MGSLAAFDEAVRRSAGLISLGEVTLVYLYPTGLQSLLGLFYMY